MPQAIVDPGELRRFAQTLKLFLGDLHTNLSAVQGQLHNLGDTWRDQEHNRFIQNFEETAHVLQRFMEVGDEHIRTLLRKAELVEQYQQQR